MLRKILRSFWPRYLLCNYQWYRKWYGGRWEYHWIEVCASPMWLHMKPDKCWPDYQEPCTHGRPIIEDWP